MTTQVNDKLYNNCETALTTLKKLNDPDTQELQSKIEWCLGSYSFDKNPAGLHEFGVVTLQTLRDIKKEQPRKINKKLIDDLEKCINNYEISLN